MGFEFEQLTLCRRARTSDQHLRRQPILARLEPTRGACNLVG